jgi:hypothetical protein
MSTWHQISKILYKALVAPCFLSQDNNRQLISPKGAGVQQGRLPPSLTRAPSPHVLGGSVSPQMGAVGSPSPHQATPPPQHTNIACFGHFERELEYRYCFRDLSGFSDFSEEFVFCENFCKHPHFKVIFLYQ